MSGTGLGCAVILAVAAKFFAVHEDPRVEQITALLPGVNCGGCGYAGCADYAKAIVTANTPINECKPGGADTVTAIAKFLGVEAVIKEREVAIVLCKGDDSVAVQKAFYNGVADCAAADLSGGAWKACRFGCLGFGTCARACPTGAIEITDRKLAIVHPELCIGCGKCVARCPRKLIKLVPEGRTIHVLCSSRDRGPAVKKVCTVGCIGCTICARTVNNVGITMVNNLATVDYGVALEVEAVIAKCPQKTIMKRSGKIT